MMRPEAPKVHSVGLPPSDDGAVAADDAAVLDDDLVVIVLGVLDLGLEAELFQGLAHRVHAAISIVVNPGPRERDVGIGRRQSILAHQVARRVLLAILTIIIPHYALADQSRLARAPGLVQSPSPIRSTPACFQ